MENLLFARSELNKYLYKLCGCKDTDIALAIKKSDFLSCEEKEKPFFDAWEINVKNGKGKIIGVNERSVLFGVYRFLHFCGCRFLTPHKEFIPKRSVYDLNVEKTEIPEYRYRGTTIEGSCSVEQASAFIDYSAKNCFNQYFIQGFNAYPFFERYYIEQSNVTADGEPFDYKKSDEYCTVLENEVKKRGLVLHSVGHGFNSIALGLEEYGWNTINREPTDEEKELIAEINGKREFIADLPINTNLCYSNHVARERMAKSVVSFLKKHPETDILHFWLADGVKNHCTCEKCKKLNASDLYVKLLNKVDEELTANGIHTKIAFLIYTDLLPPPEIERIKNEDRFILMFAPISRGYAENYRAAIGKTVEEENNYKTFPKNETPLFTSIETNLVYLKKWKEAFGGESFSFEYYFMWEQYKDFSQRLIAETEAKDVATLKEIGLDGLLSCQVQRAFFPDGFCDYLLGHCLINPAVNIEEEIKDYYGALYGEYGKEIAYFMDSLKAVAAFRYNRADDEYVNVKAHEEFVRLRKTEEAAIWRISELIGSAKGKVRDNLEEFKDYLELIYAQTKLLIKKSSGEDVTEEYERTVKPLIYETETKYKNDFDGFTGDLIYGIEAKVQWTPLPEKFNDVKGEKL